MTVKKLKCAGLAQQIGFSARISCNLLWLVKGATELCTANSYLICRISMVMWWQGHTITNVACLMTEHHP
jgi:hypothetical protein